MRVRQGLVVAVVIAGVGTRAMPANGGGAGGETPTAACEVRLAAAEADAPVRVEAAGRMLELGLTPLPVDHVSVFPADATGVLLGLVHADGAQGEPRGANSMWRVPCGATQAAQRVLEIDGADFGHAAMAADGRSLYYTGADGIFVLDLRSKRSRRLTRATFPPCTKEGVAARDVVDELTRTGELRFDRGCGYGWQWHGRPMRIRNPTAAKPSVGPAPRRTVTAVALDAGGGIWLSDGSCAAPATFDRLWRSTDDGRRWQAVAMRRGRPSPFVDQPVRHLIADAEDPRGLLAFMRSCTHDGQHTEPAWIYVSEDGGASFRAVGVPPGIPNEKAAQPGFEHDPLYAVEAPGGSLQRLILYGDRADLVSKAIARWQSDDGGRTWKTLPPVDRPFTELPAPPTQTTVGDVSVRLAPDGAWLERNGRGQPVRIFPRR